MQKLTTIIPSVVIGLLLAVSASYAVAWTGPQHTPPTCLAGEVGCDAPINVSSTGSQTRLATTRFGDTWLGAAGATVSIRTIAGQSAFGTSGVIPSNLRTLFSGKVGAEAYCDMDGLNCITPPGAGAPSGAVMAFDLASCPSGWSAFTAAQGRNIIGSNGTYVLNSTGGAADRTISVAQLPSHDHGAGTLVGVSTNATKNSQGDNVGSGDQVYGGNTAGKPSVSVSISGQTGSRGGGQTLGVMDPYIALLYCKKS